MFGLATQFSTRCYAGGRRGQWWFHSHANQAVQVGLACLLFVPPSPPLPALPVHEPSYGHHLHSSCKGSRKVQHFFLLSLTTLLFRQIPASKWSNSVFWETKYYCQCFSSLIVISYVLNSRVEGKGSCQKKTDLFGTLSQTMGKWVQRWVQSPKLFSENNHSVIFTANIQKCPKTCNT